MGARGIHDLSDDSLRWILLRLDSPLWLIRAACVCKRWRFVVTDDGADEGRAFLRLASALHPPTVVGQYHIDNRGDHRFVPSSSPAIDCSRFSVYYFLNKHHSRRHVADCYGGLVLLSTSDGWYPGAVSALPSLIVYDPLTRKHRGISGPPTRNVWGFCYGMRDVFLLDGDDGHISISNFKVLHRHLNDASAPTACVFSRGNGREWGWRVLSRRLSDEDLYPSCSVYAAGRVDGSLYLGLMNGSRIIAIDSTSLVFSMVNLPTRVHVDTGLFRRSSSSSFTVVHDAHGLGPTSLQRTSIVHVRGEELELFRQVQDSGEWVLEHTFAHLSEAAATRGLLPVCPEKKGILMTWMWSTKASVNADGAALSILSARRSDIYDERRWFFSIDVNSNELQVLPEVPYCRDTRSIFTYTLPWPQFLRVSPSYAWHFI